MNADLTAEANQMDTKQCYLLATGSATHIVDVHLVIERQVLCTVDKATHAVAALFASFYVFNTNFPIGSCTLFQFLEFLFLKAKVPRKPH